MLLRITALAGLAVAAAASAPPFVTATALRPAARGLQEECPVLTKIKKDDGPRVRDGSRAVWKSKSYAIDALLDGVATPVPHRLQAHDRGRRWERRGLSEVGLVGVQVPLVVAPRGAASPSTGDGARHVLDVLGQRRQGRGRPAPRRLEPDRRSCGRFRGRPRRRGHRARRRRRVLICFPLLLPSPRV